jgi:hypothetical protein
MREVVSQSVISLSYVRLIIPSKLSDKSTYCAEWFFISHKIDDEGSRGDEENFHKGIVERNVVHEEIKVTHTKHDQVQFLSLA